MTRYPSVTGLVRQVVKEARNGVPPKAVAHILGLEYGTLMAQLGGAAITNWMRICCCR